MHKYLLEKRDLKRVEFFCTPKFMEISGETMELVGYSFHVWGTGDRFSKLAVEAYGDPTLWWAIAYFNQKPTDGHVKLGDQILIPEDISLLYELVGG